MNTAANDNGTTTITVDIEPEAPVNLADLVCTECACCARTLTDSQSAERGIGPECFGRYYDNCAGNADFKLAVHVATSAGLLDGIAALLNRQDARGACNLVIRAIAAEWEHPKRTDRIELVRALGFDALANRLEERVFGTPGIVTITEENGVLTVRTRAIKGTAFYAFVEALREIPSRRYEGRGVNTVSVSDKALLWRALCVTLPGRKWKAGKGDGYVPGRIERAA